MDLRTARIVFIEDDPFMADFVEGQLRSLGILDLHVFTDGGTALAQVVRLRPDLILTDIHMRPVSGLDVVRELRGSTDESLSDIPVIFLSADSTKDTVAEALPLGVSGYLVKPPTIAALRFKIEQALKK